jgi:hypothetical protein
MGFNQPEIYQKLRSQCGRSDPCLLNLLDDAGPDNATRPGSAPEAAPKEAVTETMDQETQSSEPAVVAAFGRPWKHLL